MGIEEPTCQAYWDPIKRFPAFDLEKGSNLRGEQLMHPLLLLEEKERAMKGMNID